MKRIILSLSLTLWSVQVVHAERLEAIASIVNGEVITCYDVVVAKSQLKEQLRQQGSKLPKDKILFNRGLDSQIMTVLQRQEAKKLGVHISDEEIDAAVQDVEKRNNLKPGQLAQVLTAQGMNMQEYRENLKDRLLNTRLINLAVRAQVSVSEEAMREYYRKHLKNPKPVREVRLGQIFVALPAGASVKEVEAIRKKAKRIYQRIRKGENFETIAALESNAPNATGGGDMGWVSPGSLAGAFEQVFKLKVGKTLEPIRSAAGFHIIKVTGERMRKPANTEAYEEIHTRHILLKVPASADLNTQIKIRERAQSISEEMQGTSDEAFAVRAKELSQGPSASRGGDLGWSRKGRMVPAFEKVAFAMKPGETSGVVTSDFGLHIIRLVDKRQVNPNSFESHKANIEQILVNTEMQQQVPRWLNGLKEQAKIEIRKCPKSLK